METESESEVRVVLSAKISETSAKGWHDFCAVHGITVSAMLEIAGRELAKETNPPIEARMQMVKMAREIDRQRRARK
ncbi:MAG: hypothetical protein AAGF54_03425 [Pseudomonadota bacterium]